MDRRVKFSYQQKVAAVRSITSKGSSILQVSRRLGCRKNTVVRWLRTYTQHGIKGLAKRNGTYSGRFKVSVVRYILKSGLSLMATAVKFNIPNESAVIRWLKTYERQGAAGLLKEKRGRKKRAMSKKVKQVRSAPNSPEEKLAALQKENEYLRAENAFLKKLEALIQQEKAEKAGANRQKPSGN